MPKSAPCLCKERTAGEASRRFAMVGLQQSLETLDADDLTLMTFMLRFDDLVETLVNPLVMVVGEVLGQNASVKRQWDHLAARRLDP